MRDDRILRNTALYVEINPEIGNGATDIASSPAGLSRMRNAFGSLGHLHSFCAARVDGPLSDNHKSEMIDTVCRECPTATELVRNVLLSLRQADEQADRGQLRKAIIEYKTALSLIRSCCWRYDERYFVLRVGRFRGLEAWQATSNIEVRLQGRIAAMYLQSGQLRMARIYTERAFDPRRPYYRGWKQYHLELEPWQEVVYAEVLHVAANLSYTYGDVSEACGSLEEAGKYVPYNEEQKSRYEAWEAHRVRLWERRENKDKARDLRRKKDIEKAEAMIQVVCYRWKKGDRLLRSGRSILAASTYQTALSKIGLIRRESYTDFNVKANAFQGFDAVDTLNALAFKLQAALAAAHLMSRQFKDVVFLTKSALRCNKTAHHCPHRSSWRCDHSYRGCVRDWADDQRLDYQRIHYCRAIALKYLGDTEYAIEHMEKALTFDPGDGTAFAQLTQLKQELAEKKAAARKRRFEKIHSPQNQLRTKQAKRRSKARKI